jgi:tetratricopeptide (TPR) repeat protein
MSPLNLMNHYQMTQAATAYYARQELLTSYGCWDLEMGMASADPFKSNTGIAAKLSKLVMTISPHSAIGAAGQVRSAFASIPAATLDAWSKEFVDNPAFNTALAVHYRDQGQVQAAIPYFANALRMSPDYSSVENLADAYKQVNDIDHWLSTLKDAMQREDYGLDHAQYNGQIAHYYMDKGDYQSALPYAEASNESGASWAMETLIICQTQLGDFKEANELWKEETDRYGPVPQWYIWCVLTDHGDLAQAKDVANAWLATGKPNGMTRVWVDEMEGNHPDQIKQMRAQYGQTKNPFDAAFLAILYDHAGDAANAVKFAAVAAQSDAGPTGQIAHLIQSSMETGKITYTMEQVMQIVSPLKITEQTPLIYLTADYLIHHGQEAEGLKWLVFVARHTAANSGSGYLAQFELHAHKIDVYHLPPDPAGAGAQPTTQQ